MFWSFFLYHQLYRSRDWTLKALINPGIYSSTRYWYLLTLLTLPSLAGAQTVQITEIAPQTLGEEKEWFEFRVSDTETLDMNNWQLSNGSGNPKLFSDYSEKLYPGEDANYFYFSPSPLSLPNNGGVIQILDAENTVLNEVIYLAAKSNSPKNYEQRETWNWSDELKQMLPQLIRSPLQSNFNHSRGKTNLPLPTPSNLFTLLINEVSPDHSEVDFIELLVTDGPHKINLQYTELKHNGTVLWRFETPFFVSPDDYLVFKVGTSDQGLAGNNTFHTNAKEGLSTGSGTVEIIAMSETSLEKRLDVLCWQNQKLSQTEQARVNKFIAKDDWNGPCVEISDLIPNESIARSISGSDNNSQANFFRHFNGSSGKINQPRNTPPTAVITIQGAGKTINSVPFFLNLSAENSTDPDGHKDLASYEWKLNDQVISSQANPVGFYLEKTGEFNLSLKVTDQSGASHKTNQLIIGLPPGRRRTPNGSNKARAAITEQLISDSLKSRETPSQAVDDFFDYYLNQKHWTQALVLQQKEAPLYPNYKQVNTNIAKTNMYETTWKRKINLPIPVRKRMKKNLSVLFSWRESPWPDLAAEWTAVVAADQKFGYFDTVYREF